MSPAIHSHRHGQNLSRRFLLVTLLLGVPAASLASANKRPAAPPRQPFLHVLEESETGITFTVDIPDWAVRLGADSEGYRIVEIPGLFSKEIAGRPQLPVLVVTLGVPDDAQVQLYADPAPEIPLPGPPMRPVQPPGGPREFHDADAATKAAPWPEERVVLEEMQFRSLRLARLQIYPARYDAGSGNVLFTPSFRLRVEFTGGDGFFAGGPLSRIEEQIASRSLLNAATLRPARRTSTSDGIRLVERLAEFTSTAQADLSAANRAVKVRVSGDGLVRVSRADLEGSGFDPSLVDPRNLEVSFRGSPIPCRVAGEADGVFDAGNAIEFYGTPNRSRFSDESVYWIEEKAEPGLRFASRDATPGGALLAASFPHAERFEEGNSLYTLGRPAKEGDPHFFWVWFEDNPNPPRVTTFTHSATLLDLDPTGGTARLRGFFFGRTDPVANPDHQVRFFVNDVEIGETTWNGQTFHLSEVAFPPTPLIPGPNSFRFDFVPIAFPDIYLLDWYEVEYRRLVKAVSDRLIITGEGTESLRYEVTGFASASDPVVLDITEPLAPVALSGFTVSGSGPYTLSFQTSAPGGRRFLVVGDGGRVTPADLILDVPSSLKDPGNGADEIIIVPEGWESALEPLVAHRQSQGLRVVLANLTDVADEFAGGNVDDVAIRDFAAYAYANWQAPPVSYLLLVGEANMDVKNYLDFSPFYHFMPTHFGVTAAQGETITDTWFGAVAGQDLLPDVAVGRFSVRSAEAAGALAAKIIAYESNPPGAAPWGQNVLLIAANEAQFELSLEKVTAFLPAQFTVDRQYRRLGATTSSIRSAFNSGALIASFVGHGHVRLWADKPGGAFFLPDDAAALANVDRVPFVTALNCLNGNFAHPFWITSLAEAFHNLETTGALAFWSPSALGFLSEYDALQPVLYRTLFEDRVTEIGLAASSALVETFLTRPISIDVVKEMVFQGDPAGWIGLDSDADGLIDRDEISMGLEPDDADTDDDGLLDGLELDPMGDVDGDGVPNVLDTDADNDGLPDGLEAGVATPHPDTDLSKGFFHADLDPSSTTDPLVVDTDGGGAPDGAEDRNGNGAVDSTETNPLNGADDPECSSGPPPEIATQPGDLLVVTPSGEDVVLSWGDASSASPCVLYRVYVADDLDSSNAKDGFRLLSVTGVTTYTHLAARTDGVNRLYLIVGWTISGNEGPWGHFEP